MESVIAQVVNVKFRKKFAKFDEMQGIKIFVLWFCLTLPAMLAAQGDSVTYGTNFRLADGIYLQFGNFRTNKPIPKSRIVSDYDSTRLDFIRQVLSKNTMVYKDDNGTEQTVSTSKIWGYAENGAVYLWLNNAFNRIMVIGSICHFTAYETTYAYMGSPVGYGSPYGTPQQQLVQLVLDTKTGSVLQFNSDVILKLLQPDKKLFDEFSALHKKKRREQMFIYLRKFNEAHPLKFPV